MCGIAGFFLRDKIAELSTLRWMCRQISHRGPDDEGFHLDGGCAIGMRRLSIIDLSTGHQPISNEDASVWIVFNGEIYNFQELRERLLQQGHQFKTNSDTETIVHLYEQEGIDGLRLLRGMFAFCIWDSKERRILLARDRFGKKPLYYALLPQGIYFASEMKSLRLPEIPADIDQDALRLYFQLTYIPEPYSAFTGIRKLMPGAWLTYSFDGSSRQGRYWTFPAPAPAGPVYQGSEDEACARLRNVFDESVKIRMIADVPLGAFLSGGIDSSAVVASMALQSRDPVKTFSIGWEEAEFNELEYARLVAKLYKTDHHELVVRPDAMSLVQQLIRQFDEPFGDSSAIPTFLVSQLAVQHVKVALSGDGGDELFAGYDSFKAVEKLRGLDFVPKLARKLVRGISELLPYSAYGKNYLRLLGQPSALERYVQEVTSPYELRRHLLTPEWMLPGETAFFEQTLGQASIPEADIFSKALYFETVANLPGDMLVKVDRMSMANSLEVRCPLLDHVLGELAASFPPAWKLRNGTGKYILLKALADRLPPQILKRQKKGFGVPLRHWFRGPLRQFLWDHLLRRDFLDRNIVTPGFVRYLLTEHDSGRRDNSHYLWHLLVLEMWFADIQCNYSPSLSGAGAA
jgi:asparagine synthase (glutamine-hydrolysing)